MAAEPQGQGMRRRQGGRMNVYGTQPSGCPWSDAQECQVARERSVAGISNDIPACPLHGEHPDMVTGSGGF